MFWPPGVWIPSKIHYFGICRCFNHTTIVDSCPGCSLSSTAEADVDLGDVQETLLIPLYFRAKESKRPEPLFRDDKAVEILPQLRYDFSGFEAGWSLESDVVVRTVIFDELVSDFISRHPNARIINLGCGLDARFWRLDNGRIEWFDLDMPDAIGLRRRFLDQGPRNRFIAQSMFETGWFDQIDRNDRPTLIVAEALFFYFDEKLIRELFAALAGRFPGAELIFQSIARGLVGRQKSVPLVRHTRATFQWGLRSGRDLTAWNPNYQFLNEWSLVDRCRRRWRWYQWVRWIPPVGRYLREVMKITHMKLPEEAT